MRVKVRGIYSTGLIKYLLNLGYTITEPSRKQKERFGIENNEKPDISIQDLKDRSGISILGKNVSSLIEDLKSEFWDSIFIKKYEKSIKEGKYVKIIDEGIEFIKVSEEKRLAILEAITPFLEMGVGFIFKQTAEKAPVSYIVDEIKDLLSKSEEKIEKWYVFFGRVSKEILDKYRDKVIPTIKGHHVYRRDLSEVVDYAEILKSKNNNENVLTEGIRELIAEKLKYKRFIKRYHRKPNGLLIKYNEFIKEVKIENGKLKLTTIRYPKPVGIYDGLGLPKEEGDYIITEYTEGEWYFIIRYYNKNGNLKGIYVNINTPIEITSSYISYNDLAIDIIRVGDKKFFVDEEELELYYNTGSLTKRAYETAKRVAKEIYHKI